MKRFFILLLAALMIASWPILPAVGAHPRAARAANTRTSVAPYPAPNEIVAAAPAADWADIAADDLLVMDLAPDAKSKPRRVIIQLMPAPFSQGWVGNIRKLAAAHWYDGTSVNRAQDNYVVQWGDAKEKKALPDGLATVSQSEYGQYHYGCIQNLMACKRNTPIALMLLRDSGSTSIVTGHSNGFYNGFPVALEGRPGASVHISRPPADVGPSGRLATSEYATNALTRASSTAPVWPIHCYGMVGVGRGLPPDTGTGAELYTVIGQAPRHLDRNIALVGRVVEGIENLSSLPRGTEALGFYKTAEERVPIVSIRIATALPATDQPHLQYLSTESASFARYVDARANRRDPFFIQPAGGVDICNVPVPVRHRP
jgi:peptidylprolyl isomerase